MLLDCKIAIFHGISFKISCGVGGHGFVTLFVRISSLNKRDKFFIITAFLLPYLKLVIFTHSVISSSQQGITYSEQLQLTQKLGFTNFNIPLNFPCNFF